MKNSRLVILSVLLLLGQIAWSQIRGKVVDTNGEPMIGVTVSEVNTNSGTVTDIDGNFEISPKNNPSTLLISFVGFQSMEVPVTSSSANLGTISLQTGYELDEIVLVGSRGKPRTILSSAVPVDNISTAELRSSGQVTVDQMLNYKVPSYNSSNQTISDATAHFDPSELRNLGPSRTLVLVNGKRKNQSALVYVNDTPGKGEVGTDMKSIPHEAIQRIEVLRDGAAAQYGSDAVAGVINIVLKENNTGMITANTGVTTKGDGWTYDLGINKGLDLGNGFLNLTGSYYHQDYTDRAGEPGEDRLFGVDGSNSFIQSNPDLGMIVGQPEYDKFSLLANLGLPYGEKNGEFYATAGGTWRDGKSFALYRPPYWITDDYGLLTPQGETYDGFQPTFETDVTDYTFIAGTKNTIGSWNTDLSVTFGQNDVSYFIGNTINTSLEASSPTGFDAGAYRFGNLVGNLDLNKDYGQLVVNFGVEARRENFKVTAGQEESYVGPGAQSFPGLQPSNALSESRSNVGIYLGLDYDLSANSFLSGAIRYENYSDFGSNVSWKVSGRQFFSDQKGALRASVSTGFRAPSLHQIYLSNIQTLVSGGTVSNQGTFNNTSEVIKGLGVPALDAETSFNFTLGATYKLDDGISLAVDYYNIKVDDRVLFTGEIGFDGDDATINPVEEILNEYMVTSLKYFVNALDTRTTGLDVVFNYKSNSKFGAVASLNLNNTTILNDEITSPGIVGEQGYSIFSRKEQSRITTARPKVKALLGLNTKVGGASVTLNNTYFGPVTWQHGSNPAFDQSFSGKVITDLIIGYKFTNKLDATLTANNIFNVYPDEIEPFQDPVTDLGGRFRYPWEVNQFGFLGTIVKLGLSYKL